MKEWRVTLAVQAVYGRMPKALQLVRCDERHGILYELAEGQDLFHRICSNPFLLLTAGKRLAKLHVEIHEKKIIGILTVKTNCVRRLNGPRIFPKTRNNGSLTGFPVFRTVSSCATLIFIREIS